MGRECSSHGEDYKCVNCFSVKTIQEKCGMKKVKLSP
jgi:hypothetical protein